VPTNQPEVHFPVKPVVSPRLLRIAQAAQYIGATNWFVEELCRKKQIPFLTVGKYRVIDIRALDRWIEAQSSAA
jgi:excisionase family DNA binding protein